MISSALVISFCHDKCIYDEEEYVCEQFINEYVQEYDTSMFVVEKGQTNNYLDELLEQLDVDLNSCANPDYVK